MSSKPVTPKPVTPFRPNTRSRRTVVVAGAVVALGLGTLVVLPGSGEAVTTAPTELASASVARSSSALNRGLAAQNRGVLALSTLPAAAAVVASAAAFPVLRPGARVPAVTTLQARLGLKRTGWYGPITLAAVVAFQKAHGLPAQGYVGMRTWNALITGAKPTATGATKGAVEKAAVTPVRKTTASRLTVRATVTAGRVCPAPGAAFGDGWGVPRGGGRSHQGLDLSGRMGMALLAIEDGVVIREGRQRNGALRIVLQGRSGSKFYYGHMSRDLVRAGSRITRGQVIALMGDSGSPGQVHLHFEYWKSGGESAAVNPASLLRSLC